jgi:hypothetical protein
VELIAMTTASNVLSDEDNKKRDEIISEYTSAFWFIDFGHKGFWSQHLTQLSNNRFVLSIRSGDTTDREDIRGGWILLEDMTEEQAISNARHYYNDILDVREKEFGDREGLEVVRADLTLAQFERAVSQRPPRYYAINPRFDAASSFGSEGLAPVRIGDEKTGKWGYIDKAERLVIEAQFDEVKVFTQGLAAVRIGDAKSGKWGYIDRTGLMEISPQFDRASAFSEGLAAVRIGDDETGKWGYIDKTGKIVYNPQFDRASEFSAGLAAVRVGDDKTGKWGYIDTPPTYRQ